MDCRSNLLVGCRSMGLGHHHDATKWQTNIQCWKNRSSYCVYWLMQLTFCRNFVEIKHRLSSTGACFIFFLVIPLGLIITTYCCGMKKIMKQATITVAMAHDTASSPVKALWFRTSTQSSSQVKVFWFRTSTQSSSLGYCGIVLRAYRA